MDNSAIFASKMDLNFQFHVLLVYCVYYSSPAGVRGGVGVEATGFRRSKHQPDDDPRPYLQLTMFGGLFGADVEKYWKSADALNYRHEVIKIGFKKIRL